MVSIFNKLSCKDLLEERNKIDSEILSRKSEITQELRKKRDKQIRDLLDIFTHISELLNVEFDINKVHIFNEKYMNSRHELNNFYLDNLINDTITNPVMLLSLLYDYKRNQIITNEFNELKNILKGN